MQRLPQQLFTNRFYRFGQDHPFRLAHDALLQQFGRIALFYLYRFLRDDRSAVAHFGYVMHRCARNLYAARKHGFVHVKPVKSFPAKTRDKRRVYVDHAEGKMRRKLFA